MRHDRKSAALSERRFTRLASAIRSTARKSARPRPITISGSGPTRSVHCGGTDHTVAPSSCSKRRSPYRLYRLPTHGSRRSNNGWNGCVTRTNCSAGFEESAFSVELQALGAGSFPVAEPGRWRSYDLIRATRLSVVRHRLATSAGDVAANIGGMTVLL